MDRIEAPNLRLYYMQCNKYASGLRTLLPTSPISSPTTPSLQMFPQPFHHKSTHLPPGSPLPSPRCPCAFKVAYPIADTPSQSASKHVNSQVLTSSSHAHDGRKGGFSRAPWPFKAQFGDKATNNRSPERRTPPFPRCRVQLEKVRFGYLPFPPTDCRLWRSILWQELCSRGLD